MFAHHTCRRRHPDELTNPGALRLPANRRPGEGLRGLALAAPARMTYMIPALILIALLVVAFLAWELYFAKNGHRAMVEQHRSEGKDEEPNTL